MKNKYCNQHINDRERTSTRRGILCTWVDKDCKVTMNHVMTEKRKILMNITDFFFIPNRNRQSNSTAIRSSEWNTHSHRPDRFQHTIAHSGASAAGTEKISSRTCPACSGGEKHRSVSTDGKWKDPGGCEDNAGVIHFHYIYREQKIAI